LQDFLILTHRVDRETRLVSICFWFCFCLSLTYSFVVYHNFNFIIKIFLDNYPIHFIFDTINLLLKHKTFKQTDKPNFDNKITWFTIPFLPCIYMPLYFTNLRALSKTLMSNCLSSVWINLTELLKHKKTFFLTSRRRMWFYKINCKNCNASYVE